MGGEERLDLTPCARCGVRFSEEWLVREDHLTHERICEHCARELDEDEETVHCAAGCGACLGIERG
jgi:hypothetical protein